MELFSHTLNINFMKYRWALIASSCLLFVFAVVVWIEAGPKKYGIDFIGGTELVVRFETPVEIAQVRKAVDSAQLGEASVQQFEGQSNDFSIRMKSEAQEQSAEIVKVALAKIEGVKFEILKQDYVGPIVGEQIKKDGVKAIIFALLGMLIYMTVRFEFRFALGAIIAMFHDSIIVIGFYVLSGKELSAGIIAAVLTLIGYSVNDTIVVFDRIRENMVKSSKTGSIAKYQSKYQDFIELVNASINQTLSRTLLTSIATLFVCFTLWQMGGSTISDFAFCLFFGIIIGTYSSIFVATPIVIALGKDTPDLRS